MIYIKYYKNKFNMNYILIHPLRVVLYNKNYFIKIIYIYFIEIINNL